MEWHRFEGLSNEELKELGLVRLRGFVGCEICGTITNVARVEQLATSPLKGVCCELCADGVLKPKVLERWRHFKGNEYQIIAHVNFTEHNKFYDYELEPLVKALKVTGQEKMMTVERTKDDSYVFRDKDIDWADAGSNHYVLYQALYGEHRFFLREYNDFMGKVDKQKYPEVTQKYRFERVAHE